MQICRYAGYEGWFQMNWIAISCLVKRIHLFCCLWRYACNVSVAAPVSRCTCGRVSRHGQSVHAELWKMSNVRHLNSRISCTISLFHQAPTFAGEPIPDRTIYIVLAMLPHQIHFSWPPPPPQMFKDNAKSANARTLQDAILILSVRVFVPHLQTEERLISWKTVSSESR